jgi:hypothetical protein
VAVLAVSRLRPAPGDDASATAAAGEALLHALAARPGFRGGELGAATEGGGWVLVSRWDGAGHYRRALASPGVRPLAHRLLAAGPDEAAVFTVHAAVTDPRPEAPVVLDGPDLA